MDRHVQNSTRFTSDCSEKLSLDDFNRRKHNQAKPPQEDLFVYSHWQPPPQISDNFHPAQGQDRKSCCDIQNVISNETRWSNCENIRFTSDSPSLILVIGDELIYTTIKDHLALHPYRLQYVTSTQPPRQYIEEYLPDLVIYDVISSHFDGIKLNQELNSYDKTQSPPTIFLVERDQIPELINAFEAGCNDYLVKPFTRHELLIRIRAHLVLLNMNDRLTRLRKFTNEIARDKDLGAILHRTFRFLQREPYLADVTVFNGDTIHYSNCKERSAIEGVFYRAKHTTQSETFYTLQQGSYRCFLFKFTDGQSWTFIIRIAGAALISLEKEYIKNIFNQICIIQDNLHSDICDPTTITSLYTILSKKDHLLFVKSAKQYVELYAKKHRPELLAISLKKVSRYFNDHLFRVHRSYLVNPNEIQRIRRKKRGRYEILISEHVIPVGELYLPALRNRFSHWF